MRRDFVFYTNFESAKGREILGSMKAAMCFHWKSLRRQVRIRGPVEVVSDAEADAYFATRPRGSRIGAWASKQSRDLESRFALEKAVADYTLKYPIGEIPRPPYWSGFRIVPQTIEFWHDRPFRLHDRVVFARNAEGGWGKTRLYPLTGQLTLASRCPSPGSAPLRFADSPLRGEEGSKLDPAFRSRGRGGAH